MISISNGIPSGVRTPGSVTEVEKPQKAQNEEARAAAPKPRMDEYVPEEAREPSGRYWLGRDEDGSPKVFFDDPARLSDGPERPENGRPEKAAPSRKTENCRCDTDEVDQEIEKLKQKQESLERQIGSEPDERARERLEQELARVEVELRQKDNDAYRRQHSTFT